MSSDTITLKVRLVDKKVFKKFQFFPKKTVKEARLFISKELEVDPEQYGLFLPPKDDQNGMWFRDDYPLDFYGLEGDDKHTDYVTGGNNKKSGGQASSEQPQHLMEFVEFKKRYRPIKVAKADNQLKTVMVDDTMNVCDAIKVIVQQVPVSSAITDDQLYAMNVDEVEVLSSDMTIREQGYVGECTTGLHKTAKGEVNLFVKVPFFEGWLMRKRGGGVLKGLKNWNKRWYVLKKNKLLYYKSKGVGSEMGCIYMKTVQAVRPARDVTEIPSKYSKLCFEIVTPARTFIMLATNNSDLKKWIEILDFSRRMFAYETQFFGLSSQKKGGSGGVIIGSGDKRTAKKNNASSSNNAGADDDDDDDDDDMDDDDDESHEERAEQEKKKKEEVAAKERVERERKEKEEKERVERREREERERVERAEREEKERKIKEEEEKRLEEERFERERKIKEEEERLETERLERERKIKEEQEILQKQQEEFIAKQQQLEAEKQKQLQDQIEEDRRLEELMIQMELDQEERIKIREEQERLETEKIEMQKKLEEEEKRLAEEKERIRVQEERIAREKQEEAERQEREEKERIERIEQERVEQERIEKERQEREEKERVERVERIERERVEREKREEQERIEREEREEQERVEREEQERIEREQIELLSAASNRDEDEGDLLEQFEKEEEERERAELASKRLRSLHARLDAVEAETPELKLLLSEASLSSPENLLISWANYITGINDYSRVNLVNLVNANIAATSATTTSVTSTANIANSTSGNLSHSTSSGNLKQSLSSGNLVQSTSSGNLSQILNSQNAILMSGAAAGSAVLSPASAALFLSSATLETLIGTEQYSKLTAEEIQELEYQKMMLQRSRHVLPISDLKSVEANIELYACLLYKLEPQEFNISEYAKLNSIEEKAEFIHATLTSLDVTSITVEQILSTDSQVHLSNLLTIYEEVGGSWQEDFQTQVVSKRHIATKYISHILSTMGPSILSLGIQIPEDPYQLVPSLLDGRVLCFLINKIYPGTIDERVIDKSSNPVKVHGVSKNLLIALNASKALGSDHQETYKTIATLNSSALHNLIWSIVETCLLQSTDPTKNRHLFHLARAETRNTFKALEKEKIMLRWFNYHLRKGTSGRSINNFTDDVEDCENYAYLFDRIAPQVSRLSEILAEDDWEKRAEIVLEMAAKVGCMPLLAPRDIVESENSKLNLLFVADIMRVCHGLPAYQFRADVEELDDQVSKSKEQSNNDSELIAWIQSLGIEDLPSGINNLLDEFKSGFVFLKIFEKISPAGTVDSKRIKTNPTSVFKMVELCNYTMDICHKLKLNVAGIAGTDLVNGDLRANRAILNQIRRYLGEKVTTADSATAHQTIALKWANSKVVGKKVKNIQSFKDQFLQDSHFLLELLASIESKNSQIEKNNITQGSTPEEQEMNARYFLTNAWSLGIPLNVQWEDVSKVRSKSIKHIIETLQWWDTQIINSNPNNNNNNNQ